MDDTKRALLESAGMNVVDTMGRFMNSEKMYFKFLNKFLTDQTMGQLEEAYAAKDYHQIFVATHTLKGVAGNLGLEAIAGIVTPMSEAYRNDVDESYPLDEKMEELRVLYEKACDAIRQASPQ